jgi:hypothetical protein
MSTHELDATREGDPGAVQNAVIDLTEIVAAIQTRWMRLPSTW